MSIGYPQVHSGIHNHLMFCQFWNPDSLHENGWRSIRITVLVICRLDYKRRRFWLRLPKQTKSHQTGVVVVVGAGEVNSRADSRGPITAAAPVSYPIAFGG